MGKALLNDNQLLIGKLDFEWQSSTHVEQHRQNTNPFQVTFLC